ncbi:MAG: nuclear transport factor 2 family protein [Streptosporangiaceae bacterium]
MTQSDEDRVRQANAAFGSGDLGALQSQFLAADVVWHVPGRGPLAGDYEGIADVIALFGKISGLSGGTARFKLHDVIANGDHMISLATITAERAGKQYQDHLVHVMHVQDGKATEVWTYAADPFAAEEFWS